MKTPKLAAIALGSNLGDTVANLRSAARELAALGKIVARSSFYETKPVGGPKGQDNFLNAVILLNPYEPFRSPDVLLEALLNIEKKHGRERRIRWGPRTLDLDLLTLGDSILEYPDLTLPHPRMLERAFVLGPLCEAWPDFRHPLSKQTACEHLANLETSGIVKAELSW